LLAFYHQQQSFWHLLPFALLESFWLIFRALKFIYFALPFLFELLFVSLRPAFCLMQLI
jgi:hypothetical protein